MKIKVLVGIGVVVLVLIACLWRYNAVQHRSRLLSTRARSAIYAGGSMTQTIAVCILNSHDGGFQLANFIQSAVRLAHSPLRISFLCVSDPTASVPIDREVEFCTRDLDFRIDLHTAYAEEPGWFAALSVWKSMLQAPVPNAVLFIDPNNVHLLAGWDKLIIDFLSLNRQPGVVHTGTSPSTFSIVDGQKCGWPLLGVRSTVSSAYKPPVPTLLADPSTMLLHGATVLNLPLPRQSLRALRVPRWCGPLLVTDYMLTGGIRPVTLPCPFFSPISASADPTGSCDALWKSIEKNYRKTGEPAGNGGEADDASDRVISQLTKDWVGIQEGLTVLPRSICGLTSSSIGTAQQTEEAIVKYGSRTQAIAAVYEVSGARNRHSTKDLVTF